MTVFSLGTKIARTGRIAIMTETLANIKSTPIHETLFDIYSRLLSRYGSQSWWPARDPFEVMVGAVLTQNTAWRNVEKAIARLRDRGMLSPAGIREVIIGALEEAVRPSGYYKTKALKLKRLAEFLLDEYGDNIDEMRSAEPWELRSQLLAVWGIGPETADSIALYAAQQPVFVVDAYTKRALSRLGICEENISYEACQALFMDQLPTDVSLFNEYHALFVRHGKYTCQKQPTCASCPLLDICLTGRARTAQGHWDTGGKEEEIAE